MYRRKGRQRRVSLLRGAFALLGVGVLAALVHEAGHRVLLDVLSAAAVWLPLVVALEVVRIGTDGLATYLAYGARASSLPARVQVRAHIIAAAVGAVAPAGRTAAEATKAAIFAPWVGAGPAASVGATNQAATLISSGLMSAPCAVASWALTGLSALTIALAVHTVALVAMGTAMRAGMRGERIGAWLKRRFGSIALATEAFQETARESRFLPRGPVLALALGRVVQVFQYAVLAHAVGVDLSAARVLLAQGLNLVSQAVGVLVPSQVGVTEGAFALGAGELGVSMAQAMSIALLAHALQALVVLVGSIVPLLWGATSPADPHRGSAAGDERALGKPPRSPA